MALGSQTTREGMSRRYMVSRRRRPRRWPWVLLVLIGGGVGAFLFMGEKPATEQPTDTAANQPVADTNAEQVPTESEQAGLGSQYLRSRTREEDRPAAGQITLGGKKKLTMEDVPVAQSFQKPTVAKPIVAPRDVREVRQSNSVPSIGQSLRVRPTALDQGMFLIESGKYIEGRRVLSELLFNDKSKLAAEYADEIRQVLMSVNTGLLFGDDVELKKLAAKDPIQDFYRVQRGDVLSRIAPRYSVPYQFIEKLNGIKANRIRIGQALRMIKGPFHARVEKSRFLMDIYLKNAAGQKVYFWTYPVGLGEDNSTPVGSWIIEPGRKAVNPAWKNPRTNEYYASNDPNNPIGEYWLALKGTDANTKEAEGYGIHGTTDQDSVGQAMSMGCVRMKKQDIKDVFYMLVEGKSTVQILP